MRTIRRLAKEIQRQRPKWRVTVERGYCCTDRKIAGTRLRHPGRDRWGSELFVYDAKGALLLRHNNAETYRRTEDVLEWMTRNGLTHEEKL